MSGDIALDTSAAILLLNSESSTVLSSYYADQVYLPMVVIGELKFGALNSGQRIKNHQRCQLLINQCKFAPIGEQTTEFYSTIRYALKLKGRPIPANDLWIAAQCIENHWTLLTGDKHFTEISDLSVVLI